VVLQVKDVDQVPNLGSAGEGKNLVRGQVQRKARAAVLTVDDSAARHMTVRVPVGSEELGDFSLEGG
jgi:hypothetical protein